MPDAPDDLAWKLGARLPGHDYRVFTTAFVEATHPRTGALKRFSLIHSAGVHRRKPHHGRWDSSPCDPVC